MKVLVSVYKKINQLNDDHQSAGRDDMSQVVPAPGLLVFILTLIRVTASHSHNLMNLIQFIHTVLYSKEREKVCKKQ